METKDTTYQSYLLGSTYTSEVGKFIPLPTDLFDGSDLTVPPNAFALQKYVDKHYKDYQVFCCYESGCCGFSHHRLFESFGWHSIVVNPADVHRPAKAQFQKTDKIDARLLCRELKDGRLGGIHVSDVERE